MKLFKSLSLLVFVLMLASLWGCSGSPESGKKTSKASNKTTSKLVGTEITVTANADDQQNPQVIYLADNNIYFSVWEDWRDRIKTGADIYGQFLNPDGTSCGTAFIITNATGNQTVPNAAYRPGGNIAVVWQNSSGSTASGYVQYVGITGIPTGNSCTAVNPVVGTVSDAGFVQSKKYGQSGSQSKTGAVFSNTSGATGPFTGFLTPALIQATSVKVKRNANIVLQDDGVGGLIGSEGSGTVNYRTGAISITRTDPITKAGISYDVEWNSFFTTAVAAGDKLLSRKSPKISYDLPRDQFWVTWNESRDTINFASVLCFGAAPITWTYGDTTFAGLMKLSPDLKERVVYSPEHLDGLPEVIRNQETSLSRLIERSSSATTETYTYEYFTSLNNPTVGSDTSSPESFFAWEGIRNKGVITCTLDPAKGVITSAFANSNYDDGKLHIYGLFDKQISQGSLNSLLLSDLGATGSNPAVAVDDVSVPRKFLVAWEDNRDGSNTKIYGQLVNSGGGLYNTNKIISYSDTNGDNKQDDYVVNSRQTKPVISYDSVNQRYFVAWQDGRKGSVSLENLDIFGQYVDLEGTLRGGNYAIATAPGSQIAPNLAYDSKLNQFLALWKDAGGINATPPTASDVKGQLFSLGQPNLTLLKIDNSSLGGLIDFGSITANQIQRVTFKVRNSGDAALKIDCISPLPASPFSFENLPTALNSCDEGQTFDLPPSGETTLTVKFSPTSGGSYNSNFTIKSDGGESLVSLLGQGIPPTMTLTDGDGTNDGTLNFANVQTSQTKDITLTITNNSSVTYNITSISGVNAPFSLVNSPTFPVAMSPSATLLLNIRYSPTVVANDTAQLTILTDKSLSQTVNLVGTGTSIGTSTPPSNGGGGTNVPPVSSSGGGGGCFIATAAYGSYLDPHVMVLRHFRDSVLLQSELGTAFVTFYYKHSPPIADFIAQHDTLRMLFRFALTPLIFGAEYPLALGLFFASATVWYIRRRNGRCSLFS